MKDLNEIEPGINGQMKKNPFSLPEGYFESFSDRLQERMLLEKPAGKMAGTKILRPALLYFAGFCLIVSIGLLIPRLIHTPQAQKSNSEANMANIIIYSLENIDEQTLIEALPKSDIDTVSSEITQEELVKYIQEQDIDPNTINEEL